MAQLPKVAMHHAHLQQLPIMVVHQQVLRQALVLLQALAQHQAQVLHLAQAPLVQPMVLLQYISIMTVFAHQSIFI